MSREVRSQSISSRPVSAMSNSRRASLGRNSESTRDFLIECRAAYLAVFDELDEDIESREELAKVLHQAGRNPTAKVLSKYWTKKTDSLTFEDFCDICRKEAPINEADLKKAFRKIDINGDGYVTTSELSKFLMNRGERMTKQEVQELIDEVDANRDGKLDYREFIAMTLKTHQECQQLAIKRLEKRTANGESSGKHNGSRSATPLSVASSKRKESAVAALADVMKVKESNEENKEKSDINSEDTPRVSEVLSEVNENKEEREERRESRQEKRESRIEDRIESRQERRDSRLEDRIENKQDRIESRQEKIENKQDKIEGRQERRESRLEERIENRHDRVESRQSRLEEKIESRLEKRRDSNDDTTGENQLQQKLHNVEKERDDEEKSEKLDNLGEINKDVKENGNIHDKLENSENKNENNVMPVVKKKQTTVQQSAPKITNNPETTTMLENTASEEKVGTPMLRSRDRRRDSMTSSIASRVASRLSVSSGSVIVGKPPKHLKPGIMESAAISAAVRNSDVDLPDDAKVHQARLEERQRVVSSKMMTDEGQHLEGNSEYSDEGNDSMDESDDEDIIISTARSVKNDNSKNRAAAVTPTPTPRSRRLSRGDEPRSSRSSSRDVHEWTRPAITSKVFTAKKPTGLKDWKMVRSKGCFFFNERNKIVSHQYQLKVGAETAAYITIEPICVRPGGDINSSCEVGGNPMDVQLFIVDDKDSLVAYTEHRGDTKGKYSVECTLDRGLYKLIAFATGCRFKPRHSEPRDEVEIVRRPKNGKPTLTKAFRDALGDIFDICDLNCNGLMSRDEFNWYSIRTCDQEVEDAEWKVVEDKVDVSDGQITRKGFLELNELQADEEDDDEDFWSSLDAMGFNKKLFMDEVSPFMVEIFVEKGTAALRVNKLDVGGKILTNAIVETTINNGEANRVKGSKDIYIHSLVTNFRGCFVIENQSSSKANVVVDCSKSLNVMSHQQNLSCSVEVPPKSAVVAHHLMPVKESQSWIISCKESVRN